MESDSNTTLERCVTSYCDCFKLYFVHIYCAFTNHHHLTKEPIKSLQKQLSSADKMRSMALYFAYIYFGIFDIYFGIRDTGGGGGIILGYLQKILLDIGI